MPIDATLIEKFGVAVGTLLIVMGGFGWILKVTIKHFIDTIKEQTQERKETNDSFLEVLKDCTKSMSETAVALRGLDDRVAEVSEKTDHIARRQCQLIS